MDADRYRRLQELFGAAHDLEGDERTAFLAGIEDAGLREEVERLLRGASLDTGALLPSFAPKVVERVGPYRLLDEIGRGGMGAVYAARDEQDRPVAVKLIHGPIAAVPRFRERFVREARAGMLVGHANVVRTLAADTDGDTNYIAMELVEGITLRALLERLGTVPEALLREIACQAAEGLAAIHDAGIVHRDLKPENILITDDQRVRIMDLGIAKMFDMTVQLTVEGQFVGSLPYASPEQGGQGEIAPASDLYSLGVLLYELATGANPFRRENPGATIEAHMSFTPPPVAAVNPEITGFFSEVVATLLAKEPGDRFDSARELAEVLASAERGRWWSAARERRRKHVPRVHVPRATEMVGRDDDLAKLRRLWGEAQQGRGSAVLVQGEAGLGKTRLVDALVRSVDPGSHVLYGAFPPFGGMGGLTGAIENRFGAAGLEEALRPFLSVRPGIARAFASFVRGTEGDELTSDAMLAVTGDLLRGLAADKPTLWVIEDLHNAPARGRAAALSLARIAARHDALLVLTARPGLPPQDLAELARGERAHFLELKRLAQDEVVELLRDAFRSEGVAARLGERIARKSDGVPLFILEVVRGLKESDALRRQDDGSFVQVRGVDEIEVPSAVRDMISIRLSGLDSDARMLLEVGAVQGVEFDAEKAAAVLERPLVRVLQDLAVIERQHGVVRAAGRRYRFDLQQIRDVMVGDIAPRLKEEYHTQLAEAGDPAEDPYFVVYHHLHGRRPEKALPHMDAAIARLRKNYMSEAAQVIVEKAETLLTGAERARMLWLHAGILEMLGRPEEQGAKARAALAEAQEVGDDALLSAAYRALASQQNNSGDSEASLRTLEQCLAHARAAGDAAVEKSALTATAVALGRLGRHAEALETYDRAIALAKRIGDRAGLGGALASRATIYIDMGESGRALAADEEIVDLLADDVRARAHWNATAGAALLNLGRLGEAQARFRGLLETALEIGGRRLEMIARGQLGLVHLQRGEYAKAQESHEVQAGVCEELGLWRDVGISHYNAAELRLHCGRLDAVGRRLDRAVAVAEKVRYTQLFAYIEMLRGELERYRGNRESARAHLAEAYARMAGGTDAVGMAAMALALGRHTMEDDEEEAVRLLSEVEQAGATLSHSVVAATCIAVLRRDEVDRVLDLFLRNESRIAVAERTEARYRLWQATGDRAHLKEARALVDFVRDHAPPEAYDSILEAVPLHRAIVSASR